MFHRVANLPSKLSEYAGACGISSALPIIMHIMPSLSVIPVHESSPSVRPFNFMFKT